MNSPAVAAPVRQLADAGELSRLHARLLARYAISDIEYLMERMRAGETLVTGVKGA